MSHYRQTLLSVLPRPWLPRLKAAWGKFRHFGHRLYDRFFFQVWLVSQCIRHRKKAVILCRIGALGDVLCTLPLCDGIRKRHPRRLLVFVTSVNYDKMVLLSGAADCVYGGKSWDWSFSVPADFKLGGLVEAIYNPKTTDERLPNSGAQCHLIDDLANSCGITLSSRQPRLCPSPELISKTRAAYGLAGDAAQSRRLIGINCGRTWPVRMWDAAQWQVLVDRIHTEYDAVILQFGLTRNDETDEYDDLKGVQSVTNRLQSDELVALVAGCHLIVSIDSGPVHVAGAVGTPVVGLFGAIAPQYRLPPDSPGSGVFGEVPCLFCHHTTPRGHWQSGCPNGIRCMKELDVQTVLQAVEMMLAKSGWLPRQSVCVA